jgi:cytochrome c
LFLSECLIKPNNNNPRYWNIRRIQYSSGVDKAPVVLTLGESAVSGPSSLSVTFAPEVVDADTDPSALQYLWAFGDGTSSTDPAPSHTFEEDGDYYVRLHVSDGTSTTQSECVLLYVPPSVPLFYSAF